jgi:hypothetical protein
MFFKYEHLIFEYFYNLNIFPTEIFLYYILFNLNRYENFLNKNRIEYEESRTSYWAAFGTARCTSRQSDSLRELLPIAL